MVELSIIVPVYNAGALLEKCAGTILKQTYTDFELILVNDGSSDDSGKICDSLAQQDNRVIVVHKENGGAGSARNAGLAQAQGKYVAFPDADDFCKENMYQVMMECMHHDEIDLLLCSYESGKIDSDGQFKLEQTQNLFNESALAVESAREIWFKIRRLNISLLNTPWNKIYRKDIIDKFHLRFPNERRAQDAIFNIRYYNHIKSIRVIDCPLYQYNTNDVQKKGKKFPKDVYKCFFAFDQLMKETVQEWGMYTGAYKRLCDNHFLGVLDNCVEMCNNPIWGLSQLGKIEYLNEIINEPYTQKALMDYEGNVYELEDIIQPILDKDAKLVLKTLSKRAKKEKLRASFVGKLYRRIRGIKK